MQHKERSRSMQTTFGGRVSRANRNSNNRWIGDKLALEKKILKQIKSKNTNHKLTQEGSYGYSSQTPLKEGLSSTDEKESIQRLKLVRCLSDCLNQHKPRRQIVFEKKIENFEKELKGINDSILTHQENIKRLHLVKESSSSVVMNMFQHNLFNLLKAKTHYIEEMKDYKLEKNPVPSFSIITSKNQVYSKYCDSELHQEKSTHYTQSTIKETLRELSQTDYWSASSGSLHSLKTESKLNFDYEDDCSMAEEWLTKNEDCLSLSSSEIIIETRNNPRTGIERLAIISEEVDF